MADKSIEAQETAPLTLAVAVNEDGVGSQAPDQAYGSSPRIASKNQPLHTAEFQDLCVQQSLARCASPPVLLSVS